MCSSIGKNRKAEVLMVNTKVECSYILNKCYVDSFCGEKSIKGHSRVESHGFASHPNFITDSDVFFFLIVSLFVVVNCSSVIVF